MQPSREGWIRPRRLIYLPMFTTLLVQPLTNGLIISYKLLGSNMGLAIIGFSLFLRLALIPLTKPYMESMKKMREYQKDIDKIKKKHKGDRVKQSKAQADFYKQKGINPTAGCLPQILQLVVLYALFRVFIIAFTGDAGVAANFNNLLYEPLKFAEHESVNIKFLYLDLSAPDKLDIPGITFPIPGPFILLAALVQFLSAKIMQPYVEIEKKMAKKTPEKTDDFAASMQSSMIYTFPLMTIIFGLSFPSALAIYWLTFSVIQAYQQYRSSGWGGLTPWLKRYNLIELPDKK